MLVFTCPPIALFGAVIMIVSGVSLGVEIAERRRMARTKAAMPRRRLFRPKLIQGGKAEAMVAVEAETDVEKLAG